MAKVVYNACFGGFLLSREAVLLGRKLSGDVNWLGPCIIGDKRELSNMYGSTWDRVDGALVMMGAGIKRFEKAHAKAEAALAKVTK